MILEIVSRMVDGWEWVKYFSFMTAYSPQQMAAYPGDAWNLLAYRDGSIVGIGLGGQQLVLLAIGCLLLHRRRNHLQPPRNPCADLRDSGVILI